MQEEKKITDSMIWEESRGLVDKGVICCCSCLMSDVLIPLANECDNRRIFDIEDLYKDCCPECGSCNIEWNDDDETEGGAFVCSDCGEKFDDPNIVDLLEFWFVRDWLSRLLEEKGEMIIRTDYTPDIWCRTTSGQMIAADWVFESIAKDDILERLELEKNNK